MMRWLVVASILVMLLPAASGQINGPRDYTADYPFTDPAVDDFITVVSGRMDAELRASQETWGFFDTRGLVVEGAQEVCHAKVASFGDPCRAGDYRFVVLEGGSAGFKIPTGAGSFVSEHTMGFFTGASGNDLNSLVMNETLVAPSVEGEMRFSDFRAPELAFLPGVERRNLMALMGASLEDTTIEVHDQGEPLFTLGKEDGMMAFSGPDISVAPFGADAAALPFTTESTATFTEASPEAARIGIDTARIARIQVMLQQASAGGGSLDQGEEVQDNALLDSLAEVLDAALIRMPVDASRTTQAQVEQEFSVVLFDQLVVERDETGLQWGGKAAFQYEGKEVDGAQSLYGFWLIKLPWWGWLLWVAAIGTFGARMAVKPETEHEKWDQYRWIGWVAAGVVFLFVFIMWDLEMRSVWGTSVFTTEASGSAFWITFGLQIATMAWVLGAVALPLSIIIKNGLLLGKQGTFMGLGKPASLLLAYLLGALLFLAYLELLFNFVFDQMANG